MQVAISAQELNAIKKRFRQQDTVTAEEMEKVRAEFVPGMKVRNIISGDTGSLRAISDNPNKLDISSPWMLPVDRRYKTGRQKGKKHETYWSMLNIQIL